MLQHIPKNGGYKFSFVILALILILFIWGCKDSEQSDSTSELEQCRIHMDEREWADAISTCESAGGDEGYHSAALAYMASSGLTIIDLAQSLLDSSSGSGTAGVIFDYIPTTTADRTNFQRALSYLMGSNITTKTQNIYFEALLVSSMLVFGELKDLFKLSEIDGEFTTCSLDATTDADRCGFTFDLSTDTNTMTFGGLGSSFYTNICGANSHDSSHDGTTLTTVTPNISYDVTIDSCEIQAGSVIQYNKDAYDNFVVTDSFKDSEGNSVLSTLDFYTLFDSGSRFNASGDEIPLCKDTVITSIATGDELIYDCEIFGAVFDPSSDLF
ncbi:hypothetical protein KJ966_02545 [bacterium]|nr:hypothetical protein [bacterium]